MRVLIFICSVLIALLLSVNITISHPGGDIVKKQPQQDSAHRLIMDVGKTYFLEVDGTVNGVLTYSLVDTLKNPQKTIIATSQYNSSFGTIFQITNPFAQRLRFAGYVTSGIGGGYYRFESKYVVDLYQKQFNNTPGGFIITGLELVD